VEKYESMELQSLDLCRTVVNKYKKRMIRHSLDYSKMLINSIASEQSIIK